jgi:hypothetical protein
VIVMLLITVLVPAEPARAEQKAAGASAERRATLVLNLFFWVLVFLLLCIIAAGYTVGRSPVAFPS